MFERLMRSVELVSASCAVLRTNKRLLAFPLLSGACVVLLGGGFVAHAMTRGVAAAAISGHLPAMWLAACLVCYLALCAIVTFFNTALVAAALETLRGGTPSVADGMGMALAHLPAIVVYAAIAGTIGVLLNVVEECGDFAVEMLAGLLGIAWTAVAFLVIPVLVTENLGPWDAMRRSAELATRTWGENLVGNLRIGIAIGLLAALVVVIGAGMVVMEASAHASSAIAATICIGIVALLLLALTQGTLHGIYSAALYRYAESGIEQPEFTGALDYALRTRD